MFHHLSLKSENNVIEPNSPHVTTVAHTPITSVSTYNTKDVVSDSTTKQLIPSPLDHKPPDSRNPRYCFISSMASAARAIRCELRKFQTPAVRSGGEPLAPAQAQVPVPKLTKSSKIVLQPRLCTLRSYGSDLDGVMKMRKDGSVEGEETLSFFATLSDYIESSRKSQDFEVISGRLAMVVFAATVTMEVVTGNSLFGKVEKEGIAEAAAVCLAAVTCAVVAAWMSSARTRVGRIFTLGCNSFIDSLIDQIVDGLFYEPTDLTDWSDDV